MTTNAQHDDQADAVAAICFLAAMADGEKSADERAQLQQVADDLGVERLTGVMASVLTGKTTLEREVAKLTDPGWRTLAYEMAVGVCDADGVSTDAEKAFLADLRERLHVSATDASATLSEADDVARELLGDADGEQHLAPVPAAPTPQQVASAQLDAEIDKSVLNYSILTAALELLPQNLATMAIIPIQGKMVYRVGARHGYKLGAGHIKEFIATVGVGMTGQVLEGYARKLFGKLVKKGGKKLGLGGIGKIAGGVAETGVGAAMTFATTYAIGQVAKTYYAGGRKLSVQQLRELFTKKNAEAQTLYQQHRGAIEAKAGTINPADLKGLIRGV